MLNEDERYVLEQALIPEPPGELFEVVSLAKAHNAISAVLLGRACAHFRTCHGFDHRGEYIECQRCGGWWSPGEKEQ